MISALWYPGIPALKGQEDVNRHRYGPQSRRGEPLRLGRAMR